MANGVRLRVVFFKTDQGREPVREWIRSMTHEEQQTIGSDLLAIQYAWPIGMPLVRKLEEELWEEVISKFKKALKHEV